MVVRWLAVLAVVAEWSSTPAAGTTAKIVVGVVPIALRGAKWELHVEELDKKEENVLGRKFHKC